ncbi:HEAT repeat domain-containing protein [Actinomadura sp. 3N508]|uniref:HEAT repeat domain-containing protein n=1 Tax=Actinomadura sp. 3N508 TaxID=3375153 RepID=UPI003789BA36
MFGRKARHEAEVSDVLGRALAHPAGSLSRIAALEEIGRLDARVAVEQSLALCRTGPPDAAGVGLQALGIVPTALVPRNLWPEIGQVTGVLCGPGQRDAEVLAAALPVHASAAVAQGQDPADLLRGMLQHEDGRVRAAAARSAAAAHDPVPMIGPLLALLDEDPLPSVATAAATGLAHTVCRDPSAADLLTERFAAHLDDPAEAVHAWNRAKALFRGAPDPGEGPGPALPDDLHDEVRERLASLRGLDWSDHDVRAPVIGMFIDAVNGSTRRHAPVPEWDEQGHRAAVRELLQRARRVPPGSDERDELFLRLVPDVSAPAWTDRHAVNIAVDEALALGVDALSVEALAILVTFGSPGRSRQIRAALADLRARRPDDPIVLAAMLRTYSGLAARGQLDPAADRVDELVLDLLEHENATVRATAASTGLPGLTAAGRIAERLIRLIDQDPDPAVRADAALGLTGMAGAGNATEALVRLLDHPDPVIRAHALTWAVEAGRPDALPRLLDELADPGVRWEFLFLVQNLDDHMDSLPRRLHKDFTDALAHLDETGWTNRATPDAVDPDEILADASATMQFLTPIQ